MPDKRIVTVEVPADRDAVFCVPAGGGAVSYEPRDNSVPVAGRPVFGVRLQRDAEATRFAEWVEGPNDGPAPPPPPWSKPPTDGIIVPPGSDLVPYLREAAASLNKKVYLERGAAYPPALDSTMRPHGVTMANWGDPSKPRPVIVSNGTSGLYLWCVDGFTVDDIAFRCNGTPADDSAGIDARGCRGMRLNVEVSGHRMGITVQDASGRRPQGFQLRGWIHDNGGRKNVDGSGVFIGACDGIVIEGTLFERNGWNETYAGSGRDHNLYIRGDCNGDVLAQGNVFAEASSHGAQFRSGGVVRRNTFLDNPIHASLGLVNGGGPIFRGGASVAFHDNLCVGTRLLAGAARGIGIEASNTRTLSVLRNTFALDAIGPTNGGIAAAVKLDVCDLSPSNPDAGRATLANGRVFDENAATWPVRTFWAHPAYGTVAPPVFSPAGYASSRAVAVGRRNELLAKVSR